MPVSVLADTVQLKGGNQLDVKILDRLSDSIIVSHADLGRLEISNDRIESISPAPESKPEQESKFESKPETESKSESKPETKLQQEPKSEPKKEWKSKFNLGLTGSFGNTDSQDFNLGINSVRKRVDEIAIYDMSYYYGASDGDRKDNRLTTGFRNDWLMPESRWRLFGQVRYDYDEFQSWESRVGGHVGPSYLLVDMEDFQLTVRVGIGVIKEIGSIDEKFRLEALVGGDLIWTITEKQNLTAGTTIFPDLSDTGEFRAVSNVNWSLRLDDQRDMSLTAGLFHEYQSNVDKPVNKNDVKIFAGLSFDF